MTTSVQRLNLRVRDLERLLDELLGLHVQLLEVVQRKLLAMRQSNVDGMQQCVGIEGRLTRKIRERETLRRRLMLAIGQDLGLADPESRSLRLAQLTCRLEPRAAGSLETLARRLAATLAEVAKVNEVVKSFAGRMLEHHRCIFGKITEGMFPPAVYVRDGRKPAGACPQVLDATG